MEGGREVWGDIHRYLPEVPGRRKRKSQGPEAAAGFGCLNKGGQCGWSRVKEGRVDEVPEGQVVRNLWAFGCHSRAMDVARRSGAGE